MIEKQIEQNVSLLAYKIALKRILSYRLYELKEEGYYEMLNTDYIVKICREVLNVEN